MIQIIKAFCYGVHKLKCLPRQFLPIQPPVKVIKFAFLNLSCALLTANAIIKTNVIKDIVKTIIS